MSRPYTDHWTPFNVSNDFYVSFTRCSLSRPDHMFFAEHYSTNVVAFTSRLHAVRAKWCNCRKREPKLLTFHIQSPYLDFFYRTVLRKYTEMQFIFGSSLAHECNGLRAIYMNTKAWTPSGFIHFVRDPLRLWVNELQRRLIISMMCVFPEVMPEMKVWLNWRFSVQQASEWRSYIMMSFVHQTIPFLQDNVYRIFSLCSNSV